MKRWTVISVVAGSVAVAGCLPMMAASAVDTVARASQKAPGGNGELAPQARDACTVQAAQYGTVNIIDVEQHRVNQIIVWGTVDDGKQKRSFECDYGTKITAFKLREIKAEH